MLRRADAPGSERSPSVVKGVVVSLPCLPAPLARLARLLLVLDDVRRRIDPHQALAQGVADKVGAVPGVQLAHDVGLVGLDSLDADEELLRDALVGVAFGDELEHLALAAGEQIVARLAVLLPRLPEVLVDGVAEVL